MLLYLSTLDSECIKYNEAAVMKMDFKRALNNENFLELHLKRLISKINFLGEIMSYFFETKRSDMF